MGEHGWLCKVFSNDLHRMHRATLATIFAAHNIREPRIGVDQCRFNFLRRCYIHTMSMNYVSNLKAGNSYFSNASKFVADFIFFTP